MLRLEAQRKKLEEATKQRKRMGDMRQHMSEQLENERHVKGWKKEAWREYWYL
jgi:hypothetical protein